MDNLHLLLPFCLSFDHFKHSSSQSFSGQDIPSIDKFQMFPQDRVVPVGANTTFCCIVGEGKHFGSIHSGNTNLTTRRLSRRSYAVTLVHQQSTHRSGTNILCYDESPRRLTGTVVFVGCKLNKWMNKNYEGLLKLRGGQCDWNSRGN